MLHCQTDSGRLLIFQVLCSNEVEKGECVENNETRISFARKFTTGLLVVNQHTKSHTKEERNAS